MKIFLVLAIFLSFGLVGCAETQFGAHIAKNVGGAKSVGAYKVGKPYIIGGQEYTPQENFNYTETGIASWYGPGFHGKQTANGEIFDENELTAAHRTLQMPSLVRVTNLDNGRSIVLRVNDRGPFSRGRIVDVSSKAADLLDFKRSGTAKVRVETLPSESRRIAQDAKEGRDTRGYEVALNNNPRPSNSNQTVMLYPDTTTIAINTTTADDTIGAAQVSSVERIALEPSRTTPVPGHITDDGRFIPNPVVTQQPIPASSNVFIQAGAFSNEANALKLSQNLSSFGPSRVYMTNVDGKSFYRVRLGPYSSIGQADAALGQMISQGAPKAVIVVE